MNNYLENLTSFHYSLITIVIIWLAITIYASKYAKPNSWISKLGMSLGNKVCPKCATKLPMVRKPKNKDQAMFGGWTCKNCGIEIDKYGKEL